MTNRPRLDARALSAAELLHWRLEIVRLHTEGVPVMKISRETGLGWAAVNRAIQLFKDGGESALRPSARGRSADSGRVLTAEQQDAVRLLIRARPPWYYGQTDALWNKDAVRRVIAARLGLDISVRTMGNYLTDWGLSLAGGSTAPAGRCAVAVQTWLLEHYTGLAERARVEDAVIWWANKPQKLDEALWSSAAAAVGRGDAEVDDEMGVGGEAIDASWRAGASAGSSSKRLMVSASNNQGKLRWLVIPAPFNVDRQIAFIKALAKDAGRRPVILIRHHLNSYSHRDVVSSIRQSGLRVELFP